MVHLPFGSHRGAHRAGHPLPPLLLPLPAAPRWSVRSSADSLSRSTRTSAGDLGFEVKGLGYRVKGVRFKI